MRAASKKTIMEQNELFTRQQFLTTGASGAVALSAREAIAQTQSLRRHRAGGGAPGRILRMAGRGHLGFAERGRSRPYAVSGTTQIIVTRNAALLAAEPIASVAEPLPAQPHFPEWADDFHNLMSILNRRGSPRRSPPRHHPTRESRARRRIRCGPRRLRRRTLCGHRRRVILYQRGLALG